MRARPFIRQACRAISLLSLSLLTLTPGAFGQTRAEDLFQQALRMERVSGELEVAIQLYQQVVDTGDRALGARALIRIAESYEKLGREGAREAYARILDEFGDQTAQVELARERLATLEESREKPEPATIATRKIWSGLEATIQAPTPDGRSFVHADLLGSGNLVLREISTGATRHLTHDATQGVFRARVSPDGRWVAHELHLHGVGARVEGGDVAALEAGVGLALAQSEQVVAMVRAQQLGVGHAGDDLGGSPAGRRQDDGETGRDHETHHADLLATADAGQIPSDEAAARQPTLGRTSERRRDGGVT